jgi:hypothetical protein
VLECIFLYGVSVWLIGPCGGKGGEGVGANPKPINMYSCLGIN